MKLVSIVGARPQFIKIAPFARAFAAHNRTGGEQIEDVLIHTGQHYDAGMSDIFFEELELPRAAYNLGVGSGAQSAQTARMLEGIERVLLDNRPDMVLIYGDTNSTVAGALAAVKLHIPVGHVESGLRSFNRRMPEEINRIVADHVSDLLFAPTRTAVENLAREGLAERTVLTGDSMYDAVLFNRELAETKSGILERMRLEPGGYGVATVHRAENTDDPNRLQELLTAFNQLAARELPIVFPVHPRSAAVMRDRLPGWHAHQNLRLIEPVGYLDMLRLVANARIALTDSGGLQKEAFFLGCPCVTLRNETEWVETVEAGANILTGTNPEKIQAAVAAWSSRFPSGNADFSAASGAFGDGHATRRICDAIVTFVGRGSGTNLRDVN
jgi:UDP-N-acetylglucosamine 2-epimerase